MKHTIVQIIPTLDLGGAEKQVTLLADGLDKSQFDVHVVVLTRTGPREGWLRQRNIPIHFISKRLKFDPLAWLRLRRLLSELKPDLVHTWLFAANAYGRTAALSAKVPIIVGSERCVDPWKSGWQFSIDRWLAKKTKRITTNSEGIIDFYSNHGVAREFFFKVPNGMEPLQPVSELTRSEMAHRLGIDPNRKWIVSIGRLWQQKGYKDLIWSAEMLRVYRDDTTYIIVGDGPERKRLELYADNIKSSSQVYFVGERRDVPELLAHADAFWNGSLYEGQSNAMMEAMQIGVPVIATDIPGNRDLVSHNETGLLYKLGDVEQLCKLTHMVLENRELAQLLTANAKAHLQREHSLENMIACHANLYEKWIANEMPTHNE